MDRGFVQNVSRHHVPNASLLPTRVINSGEGGGGRGRVEGEERRATLGLKRLLYYTLNRRRSRSVCVT